MEPINITDNKQLKSLLADAQIGSVFIVIKSTFSKGEINYYEFLFNIQASCLKCDVFVEEADEYHYKITFVEKEFTQFEYGVLFTKDKEGACQTFIKDNIPALIQKNPSEKNFEEEINKEAPKIMEGEVIGTTKPGSGTYGSSKAIEVEKLVIPTLKPAPVVDLLKLSLKKGDRVRFDGSLEGIITKYSSNTQIEVTLDSGAKHVIAKSQISAKL